MMKYRPEIDGLRAIAVLSVLIYHIAPTVLVGGFIGVDIFFVISGYLITSIILREHGASSFSFSRFYTRRIRRILPAVWPVIYLSAVAAILLFPDEKLLDAFWSSISSALFFANHYFASKFGYFNSPGDHTLLLHLWSLSVEEQFYLLWPVLFLCVLKIDVSNKTRIAVFCGCALFSFFGAHLMSGTGRYENFAFYLLPPRAGELLLGCILSFYLYFHPNSRRYRVLGFIGVGFITYSLTTISHDSRFPGFVTIIPSLGTVFVLSQFSDDDFVYRKVLSHRVMVYLGKISYSLYLWHWPLLALPRYLFGSLGALSLMCLVVLSFLMAHLSWVYIEKPVRSSSLSLKKSVLYLYVIPLVLLVLIFTLRLPWHGDQTAEKPAPHSEFPVFCYRHGQSAQCIIGDKTRESKILMFGDSHAGHFRPYWDVVGRRLNVAIDAYAAQTCYPLFDFPDLRPSQDPSIHDKVNCIPHLALINDIVNEYDVVILAASWNIYKYSARMPINFDFSSQLERQIKYLTDAGKQVILMAQVPWFKNKSVESYRNGSLIPSKSLSAWVSAKNLSHGFETIDSVDRMNSELRVLARKYQGVIFVDPFESLRAKQDTSPIYEGELLYANADHLSVTGSVRLAEIASNRFLNKLKQFLRDEGDLD